MTARPRWPRPPTEIEVRIADQEIRQEDYDAQRAAEREAEHWRWSREAPPRSAPAPSPSEPPKRADLELQVQQIEARLQRLRARGKRRRRSMAGLESRLADLRQALRALDAGGRDAT